MGFFADKKRKVKNKFNKWNTKRQFKAGQRKWDAMSDRKKREQFRKDQKEALLENQKKKARIEGEMRYREEKARETAEDEERKRQNYDMWKREKRLEKLREKAQHRENKYKFKEERKEYHTAILGHILKILLYIGIFLFIGAILITVFLTFTGNGQMLQGIPVLSVIPYTMEAMGIELADLETGTKEAGWSIRNMLPEDFWTGIDVVSGNVDPNTLWESETIKEDYVEQGAEEAGIEVKKLRPLRKTFYLKDSGETEAHITGNLMVNSFPGTNTNVSLYAESEAGTWKCDPSRIEVKQMYGRAFFCNRSIDSSQSVDFRLEYTHTTKAGINLYAVEGEELFGIYQEDKDPLDYYEIDDDQVSSWALPEKPVSLGIGSEEELLPVYVEQGDSDLNKYVVEVTIKNNGQGTIKKVEGLYLAASSQLENADTSESDFKEISSSGGITTYELDTSLDRIDLSGNVTRGTGETFNFIFTIDKSELENDILKEYTIEATSLVTYEYLEFVTVKAESLSE